MFDVSKSPTLARFVILNLFQDPSRRKLSSMTMAANREDFSRKPDTGSAEEWVLKQVQDDEEGKGGNMCDRPLRMAHIS
jgi:hypothetical protein